jgi:predicted dehydrogenase/threonine dehydrogenase-like Zn-dependent dehydrogenase
MKQILENMRNGEICVENVPMPAVRPGFVLVRNHYSVISKGTEGGTIKLGKMGLLAKARARPEQARKVIALARSQGLFTAYQVAQRALDMPMLLGYSSAGQVVEVGTGVDDLKPGDFVACGGAGFANHAEVVCVPRNLCVKLPEGVALRHASLTTVGAIALQSVRVADSRLGESVVVIGLGLLGQLCVQILRAAGCRVFGVDVDPRRIVDVVQRGLCQAALASADNLPEQVKAFAGEAGADAVIVMAATQNNQPVALAGDLARVKGRVVVVGRTLMHAPRETYLFKELELRTSMASGPGTGDISYEEWGIDYPHAYVRWTENRNMEAFLDLVARGRVDVEGLISREYPVEAAQDAFKLAISETDELTTGILLRYPVDSPRTTCGHIMLRATSSRTNAGIGLSVLGAGSHASNELVPLLAKSQGVELRGIASMTGMRAQALGRKYGFAYCDSTAEAILADDRTDCIYVLTRHDTHARLASAALKAGKHVFVEKPLAMNLNELSEVREAQRAGGGILMVGFNRRYAPLAIRLREHFRERAQPMSITYRANVGYRPPNHWLHDPVQGGGVVLGEACHFIDFCHWLTGAKLAGLVVKKLDGSRGGLISDDNLHITLSFHDGSVATVCYVSNGSISAPREQVEVHCDGKSAALSDFKRLELVRGFRVSRLGRWFSADLGHAAQAETFVQALARGGAPQIDLEGYFESSKSTILAAEAARTISATKTGIICG